MARAATAATALETRLFRLGTSSGTPEGQCRRCAFAPKQAISRICSVPSSRNLSRRCGETSAVRKQAYTTLLLVSSIKVEVHKKHLSNGQTLEKRFLLTSIFIELNRSCVF